MKNKKRKKITNKRVLNQYTIHHEENPYNGLLGKKQKFEIGKEISNTEDK